MSKPHNTVGKIIKIKPIDLLRRDQQETTNTAISEEQMQQTKLQRSREELENLKKEKESLINETKAEIELEKSNWENEKKHYMEEAKKEGYNVGFSLGKEESIHQYKQLLDKANSIINAATKDYHSTIEKHEDMILDIAMHTADKIMKQKITEEPTSFLTIVKTAIKELKDQSVITIYLHPSNYEFVLQQKDELVHILENETKLSLHIKEEIAENGCLIQHPFGQIDVSIDTQLQQIRNVLHEIAMENKQ